MVNFRNGKDFVKFLCWIFIVFLCFVQIMMAMDSEGSSEEVAVVFVKPEKRDCNLEDYFKNYGENFQYKTERGDWINRSADAYVIKNQTLYDAVCQTKAIIFGGMHLTSEEAFQISKKYAIDGKFDLMINRGISLHGGHIVVNSDLATKPDHREDFTERDLIKRLKLENQFSFAIFENVRPSLTLDEKSLKNAWDALIPGGKIVIYPAILVHQDALSRFGFKEYKYMEKGYRDLLRDSVLGFPACVAIKPKVNDKNEK